MAEPRLNPMVLLGQAIHDIGHELLVAAREKTAVLKGLEVFPTNLLSKHVDPENYESNRTVFYQDRKIECLQKYQNQHTPHETKSLDLPKKSFQKILKPSYFHEVTHHGRQKATVHTQDTCYVYIYIRIYIYLIFIIE